MKPTKLIEEFIKDHLVGPGSDVFVSKEEQAEEFISDHPLRRYFSGILFPQKEPPRSFSDELLPVSDKEEISDLTEEENIGIEIDETNLEEDAMTLREEKTDEYLEQYSDSVFYPTNMGLTFAVPENVNEVEVEFSFGYYTEEENERKILADQSVWEIFQQDEHFPFRDKLAYENGYIVLKEPLKGRKSAPASEDYQTYYEYKKSEAFYNSEIRNVISYFDKLTGRVWRRNEFKKEVTVDLNSNAKKELIKSDRLNIGYYVKLYPVSDNHKKYVKIQLVNFLEHPRDKFKVNNEGLNQSAIFQAKIKVFKGKDWDFLPYKSFDELKGNDEEAQILNYIYREVKNYAIGHNTSVVWDKQHEPPQWIETSFMPAYDLKHVKNMLEKDDFENEEAYERFNETLDIYDLSLFSSLSREEIIDRLRIFIAFYKEWIERQKSQIEESDEIGQKIIRNLEKNYERLAKNIKLLEQDEQIFKAFQYANTAMLIQIIISNDPAFAKKEKELYETLEELENGIKYDDIDFFKDYDFSRLSFGRPAYRPFQLAFLLLKSNLNERDIDPDTDREIVDLIWFPTGGGKTEAYLAVAAMTMFYRRLAYPDNYDGVSVIMRYTLRLLTAQQFDRASRLIAAMEFLRSFYNEELGDEPFIIGMWIGSASTPNSINKAGEVLEKLSERCDKNDNPERENKFQITSCPWCGTKLITKKEENGKCIHGFDIRRGNFIIRCKNKSCHFKEKIPVQVVDEMIYKQPPTLLFGTVDKFANLAKVENGHKLFNSQEPNKLPPDLIIQDELHLLSGPLGSMTGLFESIIELLATKEINGKIYKPKIISSTATARNSNSQIQGLYGRDKTVNIFPPTGLSYKDSFFAKIDENKSKRRYIGFMPTGKTSVMAQLSLITHLLTIKLDLYELYRKGKISVDEIDMYWTLISYYNSLKELGKTANKVRDEIVNSIKQLLTQLMKNSPENGFVYVGLPSRTKELTSRIESYKIKQTLTELEENRFTENTIQWIEDKYTYAKDIIDLVLATNMISVGIDVDRFNLMLINGMPRNTAEYIQASSRVGRKENGLVFTLFGPALSRDKSIYEHFMPYHRTFYKNVEPVSVTPFTENTIKRLLPTMVVAYVRHKIPGMYENNKAKDFMEEHLEELKAYLKNRFGNTKEYNYFESLLNEFVEDWKRKINNGVTRYISAGRYPGILKDTQDISNDKWILMNSLRDIDTDTFVRIY